MSFTEAIPKALWGKTITQDARNIYYKNTCIIYRTTKYKK